ncbi:golgi uridine diphosphate-N- acetylglucosamine transporter [Tieghemiomyces parasiticus]|uniref:Golgi uridine diphosphate-N- acetylglucosamine transporter n=1 Tax=Tieghemiomyces parasiticus TaxID=78921 RepID=A0A9W8E2X1_9FUNG|nr:golgi uridine diphosphate-N- acetylglucosamine transporter [Tieghemiomyces parasiticus]
MGQPSPAPPASPGHRGWLATVAVPDWAVIAALVFGGCCSNVFALESIVSEYPRAGNLITFTQFVAIALEGLGRQLEFPSSSSATRWRWIPRLRAPVVPLSRWLTMVVMYFTASVLNNWALAFHIAVPLHIVFRSGGLMMNMVLGYLAGGKRYTSGQILSVALVTVGVVTATLGSNQSGEGLLDHSGTTFAEWLIGIGFLVVAMVLIAALGLYQEITYRKYSNVWREGLFYNHALSLPFFLPLWPLIRDQAAALGRSPPVYASQWLTAYLPGVPVPGFLAVGVPVLWVYLALNVASHMLCATGVNRLVAVAPSLTVNLILNLRKLISLILSVIIFNNSLSVQTAVGCALAFAGSLIYSQTGRKPAATPADPKKDQ